MKKIVSMIMLISLLLITMTSISYAAATITVSASVNNSTRAVTIYGSITSGQGQQVTVLVVNPSGGTDYVNQATSGADGSYQFTYILDEKIKGKYNVSVGGEGISSPVNTTFTYTPRRSGGGSSGSSGDSGSTSSPAAPAVTPSPEPSSTVTEKVEIAAPVVANGAATVTVESVALSKVFEKFTTALIQIPRVEGVNSYNIILPVSTLSSGKADWRIEVETDAGTIIVPGNMLNVSEAAGAQSVKLSIAAVDISKLDADIQAKVGNRPVVEISLSIGGETREWNNPEAPVTVSIPYTPTIEELTDQEHIVVWYIDNTGKAISVPTGKYDSKTGKVTFKTSHFSKYAVVYVKKTFDDISSYTWAKKSIEVMASKGVINGTSDSTYTPEAAVSRGDFMLLLVKALGLSVKVDSNFSDVDPDAYYAEALGIAKKLGIATGVGENKFNPEARISRQDMMTLINRAMTVAGKEIVAGANTELNRFADKESISSYALQSVATLIKNGIVTGDGTNINPLGDATRAETAVLIYRIYNK